jgi:hypothetical protein
VVKGAAAGLGYISLLKDFGVALPMRVWTDSSASKGICGRQGLGKVRHLDTQDLWVQQRVRRGDFILLKIDGERNAGDLFTKASLSRYRIEALLELLGCVYRNGRPEAAPALRQSTSRGPVAETTKARWADDEEEDCKAAYDSRELAKFLRKKGLPHWSWEEHSAVEPTAEFPEAKPPFDVITNLGEKLGKSGGGKAPIFNGTDGLDMEGQ